MEQRTPGGFSDQEATSLLRERSNWGRWGNDDEIGTINLITSDKRRQCAELIEAGEVISLSRPFPTQPSTANPFPAQHFMMKHNDHKAVVDYYGISYHGYGCTHIDALCHIWGDDGMWNGRNPDAEINDSGSHWADISVWANGIVTRGVMLDVPKYRGEPFVTQDKPIHGSELEELCQTQGITIQPGDAVAVYGGREEWERHFGPWGSKISTSGGEVPAPRPGLHGSCLEFLRDSDCAVLLWDMMDVFPSDLSGRYSRPHSALFAFGVALVDNARLDVLAKACSAGNRTEFMLVIAPLPVVGGTGSPVNPLAIL